MYTQPLRARPAPAYGSRSVRFGELPQLWSSEGGPETPDRDYGTNPGWIEDKNGNINRGSKNSVPLRPTLTESEPRSSLRTGADGPYEVLEFWLSIQAGGTELCARIEWVENGKQKHGPVTIMPEPIDPLPLGENVSS